jgi:hypothetical protein
VPTKECGVAVACLATAPVCVEVLMSLPRLRVVAIERMQLERSREYLVGAERP